MPWISVRLAFRRLRTYSWGAFLQSIACVSHPFIRVEHDIDNRPLRCFSVVLFLTDPEHVADASLTIRYRYDGTIAFLFSVALFVKVASLEWRHVGMRNLNLAGISRDDGCQRGFTIRYSRRPLRFERHTVDS